MIMTICINYFSNSLSPLIIKASLQVKFTSRAFSFSRSPKAKHHEEQLALSQKQSLPADAAF